MKALKKKSKGKYKPHATPSTTIFRKGNSSQDDLTLLSVTSAGEQSVQSDTSQTSQNGRDEEEEVCRVWERERTSYVYTSVCCVIYVCVSEWAMIPGQVVSLPAPEQVTSHQWWLASVSLITRILLSIVLSARYM